MSDRVLSSASDRRVARAAANCLICGGPSQKCFDHDGYAFHECVDAGCRHVFVHPVPTEQELVAIYDTEKASIANSDSWTQVKDYEANPQVVRDYYFRTRINWIIKNGGLPSRDCSVLDVGCAAGMFLRSLKDTGYLHVHGMDLSELHCEYVRSAHEISCDTSLDTVPNSAFDLVNCCGVLEHAPDPVAFCEAMGRKLKPGGKLVVQVPNYRSMYKSLSGRSWVWLIPPIHLQYFGAESLERTLRKAGLRIATMDSEYNGTYVYLLVHHLTHLLGAQMPSTKRTGRPLLMAMVHGLEAAIRVGLFPISIVARKTLRHNELDFIAQKPSA